jgi:hypothetical protein
MRGVFGGHDLVGCVWWGFSWLGGVWGATQPHPNSIVLFPNQGVTHHTHHKPLWSVGKQNTTPPPGHPHPVLFFFLLLLKNFLFFFLIMAGEGGITNLSNTKTPQNTHNQHRIK